MGEDQDSPTNRIGELPARFEDVRRLGHGAEGGTWAAVDREAGGRKVVLKLVGPARRSTLARAFRVLRRVSSPHLPAVLELLGTADGGGWLVTTFVDGQALEAGPVPIATALGEGLAVAHALAAIHDAGTHHGDVSPGNVLVTPTHGIVLTDLGQIGSLGSGTPGYIAPEVLGGGGGPLADRFALGSVLSLRIFGQVPWRRPDELIRARDTPKRIHAMAQRAGVEIPQRVAALLQRLIDPDPNMRIADPHVLVERLAELQTAARAGVDLRPATTWWLPTRWPYHGPELAELIDRVMGDERPRLIAVAGPQGCGRGRVVEEIVQSIQERALGQPSAVAARLCDPAWLGEAMGAKQASWIEAWTSGPAAVVGVTDAPRWPSALAGAGPDDGSRLRAAVLRAAARFAEATLVTPVSTELGAHLRDDGTSGVVVVDVEPWDRGVVGSALEPVLEAEDHEQWVDVMFEATGGWPARVIRAAECCARAGVERPEGADVQRALTADVDTEAAGLDRAQARTILELHWGEDGQATATLPTHLHDGARPFAWALGAARRVLGLEVRGIAREAVAERRREGLEVGLALALDADAADAVDTRLQHDPLSSSSTSTSALLEWLENEGGTRIGPRARVQVARFLLREGDAKRALAMTQPQIDDPRCALEAARALQTMGRPREALELLDGLRPALAGGPHQARAHGLRWRAMVDLGRARDALSEARRSLPALEPSPATAVALLWGGLAAWAAEQPELAGTWLEQAERSLAGTPKGDGREVASLRARVIQLLGNLAHAAGDLARAQVLYRRSVAAFERAGEAVGQLHARASLAALAIDTGETLEGVEHGRSALRGLIGRGNLQALPETACNLVQLLARVNAVEEAQAVCDLVADLVVTSAQLGPLAQARLRRMVAEVTSIRLRGVSSSEAHGAAEHMFAEAANSLTTGRAAREAIEAWVRAGQHARLGGRSNEATAHLERADDLLADVDHPGSRLVVAFEHVAQAVARDDRIAIDRALDRLATLPRVADLRNRGELALAWSYDRVLLPALRRVLPTGHPARRAVGVRMITTLEELMAKASSLDRTAVRSAFLSDAGDRGPLRELIEELGEGGQTAEPSGPGPAPEEAHRVAELLRMYRRLAREDELQRLLEQVVDAMMEMTDAERGVVVVLPAGEGDRIEVTRELVGSDARFSHSIIERVLSSGEPVLSVDAAADDRFDGSRSISHLNLRSVVAVPLVFRSEVVGAAYVDHRLRRGNFDEADLRHMEDFGELAALAVAHARALVAVRSQAAKLEDQQVELKRLLEQREAEVLGLREEVRSAQVPNRRVYRGMVGQTEAMERVFRLIDRLAESDVPVVIYGESGTGKELVARAIHDAGSRAQAPFIAENCGAIPETLLESVLFGHAKGSFTGAQRAKAGLFEAADGGTIFLDEVGEMSPAMQTKLLRVLQEGEVRRVGENSARKVNVRVIAASNRDLDSLAERGEFRQDLYYRINVVKLELPPLRERGEDIPALVDHFLTRYGGDHALEVTAAALRTLARYAWPGNIRELENEVQRWVALCEGRVVVADLSPAIQGGGDDAIDPDDLRIRPRVEILERELIRRALDKTGGNQTRAAEELGLSRYGLQKKLRRLSGDKDPSDPPTELA